MAVFGAVVHGFRSRQHEASIGGVPIGDSDVKAGIIAQLSEDIDAAFAERGFANDHSTVVILEGSSENFIAPGEDGEVGEWTLFIPDSLARPYGPI